MRAFHLEIVTPDGLAFNGEVESLLIRTDDGDAEILCGHADFLASLTTGRARLIIDGKPRYASVSGGFVSVTRDITRVNAITLEWADEIDEERAKRARDNAAEFLKTHHQKNREYRLAEMKLKRALNRLSVADKD